jgi:hypothetical protein
MWNAESKFISDFGLRLPAGQAGIAELFKEKDFFSDCRP